MSVWGIVLGSLLAVVAVAIIIVIILQEGNQQGLGVVTGAADSYFSKNKARSIGVSFALDKGIRCGVCYLCDRT